MNLEKEYLGKNGKVYNILQLVKEEPEWAANRIQHYESLLSTDTNLTYFDVDRRIKSKTLSIATKKEFIFYCKIRIDKPIRYIVARLDTEIFGSSKVEPAIEFWNNLFKH